VARGGPNWSAHSPWHNRYVTGEPKVWYYQDLWGNETDAPQVQLARPAHPEPPVTAPRPYDGPMDDQLSIIDLD
jgi:hypothetical protein